MLMTRKVTKAFDRWDHRTRLACGDKLWVDGKLIEVESIGSDSIQLTFEGIENLNGVSVLRGDDPSDLSVKCECDAVDAFFRINEPYQLKPNDVVRIGALRFEVHRYSYATASVQGIRPSMEDEEFCRDGLYMRGDSRFVSMFNIYDGHGGFDASKFLRQRFHEFFLNSFDDSVAGDNVREALIRAFRKSDEELFAVAREKGLSMNVGAVVNSVVIDEQGNIYCANLGDCRSVLSLDGDKIIELSRDLTPAVPEEADRIRRCGGFVSSANRVNGRLAVSRAIGDFEYKSDISGDRENMVSSVPEIRVHSWTGSERFIVMGCDGLYDVMTSKDVVGFVEDRISQFLNKGQLPDPSQICVDLVTECVIKRGTTDNVTIIVILLKDFSHN